MTYVVLWYKDGAEHIRFSIHLDYHEFVRRQQASSSNDGEGDPPNEVPPNEPGPVSEVMRRRRFSVQQKMNIWTVARLMQQQGICCCVEACRRIKI